MNQTETELRIKQRAQAEREIADAQATCIGALVSGGYSQETAAALVNRAASKEMETITRPLGIEGESPIQETNRVWAALDTVEHLFLNDLPDVNEAEPDPVAVSLGLIDCDETIQIRVTGTDPESVDNYAARMKAGDEFPPLVLFFGRDGEDDWRLWLADGFHRYEAMLRTMDHTVQATVYAGSRRDAEEYAAICNARHGLPLSNEDKRAASRRLLKLHPEWSDREIARRVGASHPTVGKVRRAMEAETEVSGKDYQMPEERVVTRGDQTYTYTPPEQSAAEREPQHLDVWEIARDIRRYLNEAIGSATLDFSDDHAVATEQRQYLVELRREDRYDELHEHLTGPYCENDVVQAVERILGQLDQQIERHQTTKAQRNQDTPDPTVQLEAQQPPTVDPALTLDGAPRIKDALLGGDWQGLRNLVAYCQPSDFMDALQSVFSLGTYKDWLTATECLTEALSIDKGDQAPCPECRGRVIHVSAKGKPARDICMDCGAVIEVANDQ